MIVLSLVGCMAKYTSPVQVARVAAKQVDKHEVKQRIYVAVFYQVKDAAKYEEYLKAVGPLFPKYKVAVERVVLPTTVWPSSQFKPQRMELYYFEDAEHRKTFQNDPLFEKLKTLREEALEEYRIVAKAPAGTSVDDKTVLLQPKDLSKRDYWIELAYIKDPKAFEEYSTRSKEFYRKYDRETERALEVVEAAGIEPPQRLAVMYYNSREKAESAIKAIEKPMMDQLYKAAISRSIWLRGTAYVEEKK